MSSGTDISQSLPGRLSARLAIALSCKESADAYDHAHHLVQTWRRRREYLVEQVGSLNLIRIEEQFGVQTPFDRLDAGWCAIFACQDADHADRLALQAGSSILRDHRC